MLINDNNSGAINSYGDIDMFIAIYYSAMRENTEACMSTQ